MGIMRKKFSGSMRSTRTGTDLLVNCPHPVPTAIELAIKPRPYLNLDPDLDLALSEEIKSKSKGKSWMSEGSVSRLNSTVVHTGPLPVSTCLAWALPPGRSAGFQTCSIADFQVGRAWKFAACRGCLALRRFGNLRYSRLGSLRYAKQVLELNRRTVANDWIPQRISSLSKSVPLN